MKTKIIATIGPASDKKEMLKKLCDAGMDIVRINTKYGSFEEYLQVYDFVKKTKNCEMMYDIKGSDKLDWLKSHDFDYLAVSFTESAQDIEKMREYFKGKKIKIIAKIESGKGIKNIDEIIDASDGVMVARGDLSRNISYEKVPVFQKVIIKKCKEKSKMVACATEMLLSMTKSKIPEIAEVSDVANAIFDGADLVMLSEETSIGKYPVETVLMMEKIIKEIGLYKNNRYIKKFLL